MSEIEVDHERLGLRDGEYVARLMPVLRMVCKLWYRSEVRGIEHVPDGGVLIVSNHSGGLIAMDVPVIAVAFSEHFGDRPLYCLAHDLLFVGYAREPMRRAGFLPATREARGRRAACGRGHDRLPRWRLRRLPAHVGAQHDRLRRPQGLRPHRDRGGGADRADRQHRRPGEPAPPESR